MKIDLSLIKPSPHPIRTSWDEEKMQELTESIKEQGLIVPIKVRQDNGDYEIIYGHRRTEACRRAGFGEIECIVEGLDDINTLLQAGMENLSNEEMSAYDKGYWVGRILHITDWSLHELSRKSGIQIMSLKYWKNYYEETEAGTSVKPNSTGDGLRQTIEIKKELTDPIDKRAVADKVEREGLTWQQTKQVAKTIAVTEDPKMKEILINAPYSPYTHDPEMAKERAEKYGAHDPMAVKKEPAPGITWEASPDVVMFLDFIKKSREMSKEFIKMVDMGKFSPEAIPFIAGKIRLMIEDWQKAIERIEK